MSTEPSTWLVSHRASLPDTGAALDVACGRGRNALWLAEQGFETTGIDRDAGAIAELAERAQRAGLSMATAVVDLESRPPRLGWETFDVIVVTHYLHRPLFPLLVKALRRGGVLVYETFTRAQAARGRPTNPAFLLEPGELLDLVAPLEITASREGDFEHRMVASVIAVKSR